jgi:hypothetical protein
VLILPCFKRYEHDVGLIHFPLQAEVDVLRAQLAAKEQQLAAAAEAVAAADDKIVSGSLLALQRYQHYS